MTNTGWPFRFVRRSRRECCVAVAQENWPLELVPAVGIVSTDERVDDGNLYHTQKNDVKIWWEGGEEGS